MAVTLIAAVLLAPAPAALPDARQLYEQCRLYVATQTARAAGGDAREEGLVCELEVLGALTRNDNGEPPRFCGPEEVVNAMDSTVAMARVYLDYFERSPAVQASAEGGTVFRRALAEKWPCPR